MTEADTNGIIEQTQGGSPCLTPQPQKGELKAGANGKDALKVDRNIFSLMFLAQPKDQADP